MAPVQRVALSIESGEHILQIPAVHVTAEHLVVAAGVNVPPQLGEAHELGSGSVPLRIDLIDFDSHIALLCHLWHIRLGLLLYLRQGFFGSF